MSGGLLTRALEQRVQTMCQAEFRRLERKLHPLGPGDRLAAERIIAEVISAVVVVPARALPADCPAATLDALVRLFDLDLSANS